MKEIFIRGNVPSLKNSKQVANRNGRIIVTSSKTVKAYLKSFGIRSFNSRKKEVQLYKQSVFTFPVKELKKLFNITNKFPVKVGFYFIRDSRRKADFQNLIQLIADLLVAFDIIPDDNMDYFLPFPMEIEDKFYHVDKNNAGVIMKILKTEK